MALRLSGVDGKPVIGAQIELEADMSHPGMRPEFGTAKEIRPGSYQGPLTFSMPGDWVILLHVTLGSGSRIERQIEVKGVRAD